MIPWEKKKSLSGYTFNHNISETSVFEKPYTDCIL